MGFFDRFKKKKQILEETVTEEETAEIAIEDESSDEENKNFAAESGTNSQEAFPQKETRQSNVAPLQEAVSTEEIVISTAASVPEEKAVEESVNMESTEEPAKAAAVVADADILTEAELKEDVPAEPEEKLSFFGRLKKGLQKTREDFGGKMASVFTFGRKIDEEFYEELEEILIQSDVGVRTAMELVDRLRDRQKAEKIKDTETLQKALEEEIENILLAKEEQNNHIQIEDGKLNIILIVGVNGAGKTTTIGKMAHYYRGLGKKVLLAAADTFRAAAIEQLCVWGERVQVPVIRQSNGSDPGAVVFDACQAAKSRKTDVLIVDTAGRLQNKKNLMEELKKIDKIISREAPGANVECLLVLDAGTGQNAISQAKLFGEVVPLTGIILTKLDGTAKGGVVIGITNELNLPVKLIGVGEGMDDLREFVPADFAKALFASGNDSASNYDPLREN